MGRETQRKGDTATTQAIATFTRLGFDVALPITESAAYDLIVDHGGSLRRVQAKFSDRKDIDLRSIHSNGAGYVVNKPQRNSFDWLYVLRPDGCEFLVSMEGLLGTRSYIRPQPHQQIMEGWQSPA